MTRSLRIPVHFAAAALFALSALGCPGRVRLDDTRLSSERLDEYGIELAAPSGWSQERGEFFHYTTRGPVGDLPFAMLEYRGLQRTWRDKDGKRQYAIGWYKAIALSYQGWRFLSRSTDQSDAEGAFRFEGVYVANGQRYYKIGALRFRGDRVHAIYYTTRESDIELLRGLFLRMDASHEYFQPRSRG
jgi:hypothetical protein